MSGICIPHMKMPTSCNACMLDVYGLCLINKYLEAKDELTHSCPLVPVPNHDDLIDRDKLERDIDKYVGGEESRSRFHHWVQVQDAVIPMDKGEEK